MSIVIVEVVKVVNIVNSDFVVLSLLEVIGHFEVLDPLGVQVIHDDLRLANLFPKVSFFLEEDAHAISACERIQVWQIAALKREGHDVDEALIRGNTSVCSRQNGVIQVSAHAQSSCSRLDSAGVFVLSEASESVSY